MWKKVSEKLKERPVELLTANASAEMNGPNSVNFLQKKTSKYRQQMS